jgi:hypothetical protein
MLLYFTIKKSNDINSDLIYLVIMKYIFLIAILKFIERKHDIYGFFNIYIYLIIIIDISFALYDYIKKYIINIKKISNQIDTISDIYGLKKKKLDNMDFNLYPDEIINSNFDIKKFTNELDKFNKLIRNPVKSERIKIIKKEKESETEIKKFNENINK